MIQTLLPFHSNQWEILSTFMTKSTKQSLLSFCQSNSILPVQNIIINPNDYTQSKHTNYFHFLFGEVLSMKTNNKKKQIIGHGYY